MSENRQIEVGQQRPPAQRLWPSGRSLMRLAAAVRSVRLRDGGRFPMGRLTDPRMMALAGAALLVGALVALSPQSPSILAAVITGALLLLVSVHRALLNLSDELARRESASHRFDELCDTLEHRIEHMQDVQWEISESDVRYRDLLDQQSEVILRRDSTGRLTFVNSAFERVFGIARNDAVGSRFIVPRMDGATPPLLDSSADERRSRLEYVRTADGPRWIVWEEHTVAASDGSSPEIQAVGRDVTDERAHEAELAEARDQALSASRAKSRFLAAMSHEIRTPMNGILGMSTLLRETSLSDEQRTYVGAIEQSASVLMALIDEILDFSKIEAGKLVLSESPFSIADVAQGVVELLSPRAHDKGLELALTMASGADRHLKGDEARIRQILLNLLSNAVKFTDEGGVSVLVDIDAAPRDDGHLVLSVAVTDTGIGMSEADRQRLFLEFEQADTTVTRQQGGTGLGLAISRRLARAMNGDIDVRSTLGKGSTFTLRILLEDATDDAVARNAAMEAPDDVFTVLLAFDRAFERRSIGHILRSAGQRVIETTMESAEAEMQKAKNSGTPVDRLIVDVASAPGRAGRLLAMARKLADREVVGIVTVNVLARSGLAAFREEGFERYLVRPVRVRSLLQQISEKPFAVVSRNPAGPVDEMTRGADAPGSGLRVLLIEDNEINALLARRVIETRGCGVEHRPDGYSGVACAIEALRGERPAFDLILMDIQLPGLDGISATREIRAAARDAQGETRCPPIIALTANAFPEDRERYLSEGLDGYLAKPFDVADLERVLASCDASAERTATARDPARVVDLSRNRGTRSA